VRSNNALRRALTAVGTTGDRLALARDALLGVGRIAPFVLSFGQKARRIRASSYANFIAATSCGLDEEASMKFPVTKVLWFWVECDVPDYRARHPGSAKSALIAQILHEFEEAGDAMRYLTADGRVGWKATPRMLIRLADAEQEARDNLADW
jgi:hypothetical protein